MLTSNCLSIRRVAAVLVLSLAAIHHAAAEEEGKRVALIIGNNNYSLSPLQNAVNDARLMDKALRAAGFKTVLRENAGLAAMEEGAAELAGQLGPDDTALFFYAGHGVQIENENFLVPVDFEATNTVIQAKFKCFRLAQLFEELKKRAKRSIVVLDACRSNPVAQSHSLQSGLAQPQAAGTESFIAFSTGPGQVAADNPNGRDSWFTEALADLIEQPGLTLDDVFTRVKARVAAATEHKQAPWTISSLTGTFYFHPPSNLQTANDPTVAEKWMLEAQHREERQEWDQALSLVDQVVKRKPGGALEWAAVARLPYLAARKEGQADYDRAEYKQAATSFEKAVSLDPFSIEVAFQAADSYLLSDQLPEAVRVLNTIRVRGTTASYDKASAMLKEIAAVYPEAAEVLKAEIPAPPSIQQLFTTIRFGQPDWSAGVRSAAATPAPLTNWSKAIEKAFPPPPERVDNSVTASADPAAAEKLAAAIFHVEVNPAGDTRDIAIRRVANQTHEGPTGTLMLVGLASQTQVLSAGSKVADQLPAMLTLAPGKYEVRTMDQGQLLDRQEIEVLAYQTKTVTLKGK